MTLTMCALILTIAALGAVGAVTESDDPRGGHAEVTPAGSVIVRAEPVQHSSPVSDARRLAPVSEHAADASSDTAAGAGQSSANLLEVDSVGANGLSGPFGSGSSRRTEGASRTSRSRDGASIDRDEGETVTTTQKPLADIIAHGEHKVSCGGHTATRCRLCTVVDPKTGLEIPDKGPDWCHGDCKYIDGECERSHGGNANIAHQANNNSVSTTKHIPDLLNPNITDADRRLMDDAADRAIQEADYEAKKRLAEEKRKEKEKKDGKDRVLYIAIMTASSLLACCACGAVCMLGKYLMAPDKTKKMLEDTAGLPPVDAT